MRISKKSSKTSKTYVTSPVKMKLTSFGERFQAEYNFVINLYCLFSDYSNCILDLVFVVDASDKVTDDWNTQLDFVIHFAKRVNIGPQGTHIALVRNGEHAKTVFDFREFRKTPFKEQTILEKIASMPRPQVGERSYILNGLIKTLDVFNKTRFGMNSNIKKVYLILF